MRTTLAGNNLDSEGGSYKVGMESTKRNSVAPSKAGKRFYRWRNQYFTENAFILILLRTNSCNDLSRYWDHGLFHRFFEEKTKSWCFVWTKYIHAIIGFFLSLPSQDICFQNHKIVSVFPSPPHSFLISDNNQWCFEIAWEVANKVWLI